MAKTSNFEVVEAHQHFSAHCFNQAWDLIEKKDRSAEDDRLMVALNQASIYHWLQRPDCDNRRLSVGYWQASRIQALLQNVDEARAHAKTALAFSDGLQPFYVGYAHEALARAASLAGNTAEASAHLAQAHSLATRIDDEQERELLLADLASITSTPH